jgi:hypothetical protein
LWFCFALVVRPWAAVVGLEGHWTLGVAPSLFAGIALTAWIAFTWRHRPILVFIYGSTSMTLIEAIQLWLPKYVFDSRDVLAGLFGTVLLTIVLSLYSRRARAVSAIGDVVRRRSGHPPNICRKDRRRSGHPPNICRKVTDLQAT